MAMMLQMRTIKTLKLNLLVLKNTKITKKGINVNFEIIMGVLFDSFSLDKTNPRFYTLGGVLHCKVALGFIMCFMVLLEIGEWATFIAVDSVGEAINWSEGVTSVAQLAMVVCMVLSFFSERAFLLVPYILFVILGITSFGIWEIQAFIWLFMPYSLQVTELFAFTDDISLFDREKTILFLLAVMTSFITLLSWFLQVGFTCYLYFESRQNLIKTQTSSLEVAEKTQESEQKKKHSSVDAATPNQNIGLTFSNQNFSISDNEEEEEDNVYNTNLDPNFV